MRRLMSAARAGSKRSFTVGCHPSWGIVVNDRGREKEMMSSNDDIISQARIAGECASRFLTTHQSFRFSVTTALSTTLFHLGSTELSAVYSSCQFHHLYGTVWG